MAVVSTAKAVVQRKQSSGTLLKEELVQLPRLQEHQILVRIVNSALNPTDGKHAFAKAFNHGPAS